MKWQVSHLIVVSLISMLIEGYRTFPSHTVISPMKISLKLVSSIELKLGFFSYINLEKVYEIYLRKFFWNMFSATSSLLFYKIKPTRSRFSNFEFMFITSSNFQMWTGEKYENWKNGCLGSEILSYENTSSNFCQSFISQGHQMIIVKRIYLTD